MGQPAARLNDSHECPQVDPGPVPHVGKQIMLRGCAKVVVAGQPAARVGDLCACDGPLDPIAKGSTGVYFGGQQAARLGDSTGHGGSITSGCTTVLVGDTSSASGGGDNGAEQTVALLELVAREGTAFLQGRIVEQVARTRSSVEENTPRVLQALIDFNRGFWDNTTFGGTKFLREKLWGERGRIVDEDAERKGDIASFLTALIPIPGAQEVKIAKIAIDLEEFARSNQLVGSVARAIAADSNRVWQLVGKTRAEIIQANKLRGEIIERVLAVTEYGPKQGYDWVGILKKGYFENIDFINYALKEQVSVKSMIRSTPRGWQSGVNSMKKVIRDLSKYEKTWQPYPGMASFKSTMKEGDAALKLRAKVDDFKRVLDLRVPPGSEHYVQGLVAYGRQLGIEVRIRPF